MPSAALVKLSVKKLRTRDTSGPYLTNAFRAAVVFYVYAL